MGNMWAAHVSRRDTMPEALSPPSFDPTYGFSDGRKPRMMIATEAEMRALRVPKSLRDYCAHLFIDIEECKKYNYPFIRRCEHYLHSYQQCQYDDYVLRMKEYERERRLLERQKRKEKSAAA